MLKHFFAVIGKLFSSRQKNRLKATEQDGPQFKRRQFFKKVALGTVSVGGTSALAKTVVDSIEQPNLKDLYAKDAFSGEQELKQREYELMSEKEKTAMVQNLIKGYSRNG